MKLMADDDDDEVFEVTAISEQLDLRRKYAQIKKFSDLRSKGGKNMMYLMDYSCCLFLFILNRSRPRLPLV